MAKDDFTNLEIPTLESVCSARESQLKKNPPTKSIKKHFLPWALALALFLPSSPALLSQSSDEIQRMQFDTLYIEGKYLFYEILRREAPKMQLVEKEKKILSKAQKKIPGLYEHLMNFYYFHKRPEEKKGVNFQSHLLNFSRNMAEEFLQSITEFTSEENASALESVLYSTGYFSRKTFPIYREHRRKIGKQVKSQWALEELKIKDVHSLSKGKGIRLAIIDSGVDPTLRELRSRIVKWKNFLDGSKPYFEKGRFPFDWSGHGTSIASIVFQVAPEIELAIVKVYDRETMRTVPPSRWSAYLFAAGMIWAAENGADVINLSAAFRVDTKAIREAATYCWEKNVLVVSPIANVSENEGDKLCISRRPIPGPLLLAAQRRTTESFEYPNSHLKRSIWMWSLQLPEFMGKCLPISTAGKDLDTITVIRSRSPSLQEQHHSCFLQWMTRLFSSLKKNLGIWLKLFA